VDHYGPLIFFLQRLIGHAFLSSLLLTLSQLLGLRWILQRSCLGGLTAGLLFSTMKPLQQVTLSISCWSGMAGDGKFSFRWGPVGLSVCVWLWRWHHASSLALVAVSGR
jgi:hypothetical protein